MKPKKPIVFVVDDEPDVLDLYVGALGETYEVVAFQESTKALAAAQASTPELIITDQKMPNLTGMQLIRKLRQANVECPALLVTGYPESVEVLDAAKNHEVFQVCPKPWKAQDLLKLAGMAVTGFRVQKAAKRLGKLVRKP